MAENTPFLADNEHGDDEIVGQEEVHTQTTTPANSLFKRPLRILTSITALISILTLGLLIATFILLEIGPFASTWRSEEQTRDLAIVLLVTAFLLIPTIFITLPILLPIIAHAIILIIIFIYSANVFTYGWPGEYNMCRHYKPYDPENPNGGYWEPTHQCLKAMQVVTTMLGVAGLCGILIGLLVIAIVLVRVVALFKTHFWNGSKVTLPSFKGFKNMSGFTIQLSFSIIPVGTLPAIIETRQGNSERTAESAEPERLIET